MLPGFAHKVRNVGIAVMAAPEAGSQILVVTLSTVRSYLLTYKWYIHGSSCLDDISELGINVVALRHSSS